MQELENVEDKLIDIQNEYNRLCELLTYEEVLLDKKLFLKLERQKQRLQPIVNRYEEYLQLDKNRSELEELITHVSLQEKNLFDKELEDLLNKITQIYGELLNLINLLDAKKESIIVEIVASKDENSHILQQAIVEGYTNFCYMNDLNCERIDVNNSIKLYVSGLNAKTFFINESGMQTTQNTLEKGFCQVFVYDYIEDEIIDEQDIEITTCRSSGAGGQHINTTDSAIKATHIKTGITSICQDERSQFQNKEKAIDNLKIKVKNYYEQEKKKLIDNERKRQLKLMTNNKFIKTFDFQNGIIVKASKENIKLSEFIQGKIL